MSEYEEPLDSGLVADILKSKALYERLRQFHWEFHSELAYLRNKIYGSLKSSLRERAYSLEFSRWQRVVKYKYALDPLGTSGSVVDPGGRFNIGAIDGTRFPIFPALYVASDKGTEFAELLGGGVAGNSLTAEEVALTKPDSIAAVSISGRLDAVLDVCDGRNLAAFVALIKGFRLSAALSSKARRLNFPVKLVRTAQELIDVLHARDWRNWPALYDVPAACQTFGRIVFDAEIEGILYKSVLTEKPCLAVYPQNFRNSPSYIELDDPAPSGIVQRRLDATNCAGSDQD
jgi:hypothetical protein